MSSPKPEPSESSKILFARPTTRVDWFAVWAVLIMVLSAVCYSVWGNFTAAIYLALVGIFVAILRGQRGK